MKMPDKIFSAASYCTSGRPYLHGFGENLRLVPRPGLEFYCVGQWCRHWRGDVSDKSLLQTPLDKDVPAVP